MEVQGGHSYGLCLTGHGGFKNVIHHGGGLWMTAVFTNANVRAG